jgi:hypothetical protein
VEASSLLLAAAIALAGGVIGVPFAGAFTAPAAAYTVAAASAFATATDPPVPDPAFQVPVIIVTKYIEDLFPSDSPAPQLQDFTVHAFHTAKNIDALGQTEGKILGARQAGDSQAVATQVAARERFRDQLGTVLSLTLASAEAAAQEVETLVDPAQFDAMLRIVEVEGVSPVLRQQLDEFRFGS